MRAALGQPIIMDNIGGAGGAIGVARAARAATRRLHDQHRAMGEPCVDGGGVFGTVRRTEGF
jgi:tripartite-type tricarboxylate transporter receptor subunit TctC